MDRPVSVRLVCQTSLTEQEGTLACFVTELYAKLLRSSHDVIQAPSLATGCEPEGSPATGARRQTSLAKSKPKSTTKIIYVRSQRAAPSLIWSQEADFFFWGGGGIPTCFIQLQNVNHSRFNLGIRFILPCFKSEMQIASWWALRVRHKNISQIFLQTPLFKKMDSRSNTTHILKKQCDRTFYVKLKSKPSVIEYSEAQHNRAELLGLKWSLWGLSVLET